MNGTGQFTLLISTGSTTLKIPKNGLSFALLRPWPPNAPTLYNCSAARTGLLSRLCRVTPAAVRLSVNSERGLIGYLPAAAPMRNVTTSMREFFPDEYLSLINRQR
ncbi:hypothetical protein MKQ70_05285 [Chitinophaga sedimenti]|uniref:hypothetical protein n=1 Tax=Chitinophaga sedimenti TaxID=2033606 RepID=UPI002004FB76|nr:hypothetical protein [Chitinophaga sedimenti]MCK7554448.1 hypothetical protein [Chitinophaga sedimenti]